MRMTDLIGSGVFEALDAWREASPAGRWRSSSITFIRGRASLSVQEHIDHSYPDVGWSRSVDLDPADVLGTVTGAIAECERRILESASSAEASALDHDRAPDTLETGRAAE